VTTIFCLWIISVSTFSLFFVSTIFVAIALAIASSAELVWEDIEKEYLKNLEEAFWRGDSILLSEKDREYLRKRGYRGEGGL